MKVCAAAFAAVLTAALVFGCIAGVAEAAPVSTFAMVGPAAFTGTATDGTPLTIGVRVTDAELSPISPSGSQTTAPSGTVFLVVEVHSDASSGNGPTFNGFDTIPTAVISLQTPFGLVPATAGTPTSGPLTGTYYFAVPPAITSAQIEVGAAKVSCVEYPGAIGSNGKLTELTLGPTAIDLALVKVPRTTTPPTSTTSHATPHRGVTKPPHGLPLLGKIGIGTGGGGVVLVVVVIPIFIRRRRYARADRDGRVIVDSPSVLRRLPPELPAPGTLHIEEKAPNGANAAGTVTVAVLGELEFRGLLRPTTSAPVLELLCYLALHPGRSFTSAELRNSIWAEPRAEPTAQSFHNCLSKLRKALPAGVLERTGYHYRLNDVVTSDWAAFQAHLAADDDARLSRLRSALTLVRGRPFSGVGGRDPDAYSWATTAFTAAMELAIEETTHELVTLALATEDLDLAEWALATWPPSPPWSVLLEGDALRLAAVKSGPNGVAQGLKATRSRLGEGAVILEDLARELGWVG